MEVMLVVLIILVGIAIAIGVVNMVLMLRKKSSGGDAISNEDMDIISKNIFDASDNAIKSTKHEVEMMTRSLETALKVTTSASAESWKLLNQSVSNNFIHLNDIQQKSVVGMVDTINKAIEVEKQNAEKLETHLSEFIDRLDSRFSNINKEIINTLGEVRAENDKKLAELRESNEKSLEVMRATVDEKLTKTLNDRLEQSFNTISERIEAVNKGLGEMKVLSDSVGSLNRVLNNVKVRGNWGEVALDSLLEQMLSPEQYERQFKIDSKREAVDFVVKMPGRGKADKLYLPIDSKFPFDDYERMVEAADMGDKAQVDAYSKSLEARIKKEAKSISEKYIVPPITTNFAIMYLPIEGLFAEIVKRPGLCNQLQNDYKIVVCGPTTITALLNSLQLGFKTLAVQEKSLEVWKALAVFKKEFSKFADSIDKTQKKIDEASTSLSDATKRTDKIKKKLDFIENDTPSDLIEETCGKEVADEG